MPGCFLRDNTAPPHRLCSHREPWLMPSDRSQVLSLCWELDGHRLIPTAYLHGWAQWFVPSHTRGNCSTERFLAIQDPTARETGSQAHISAIQRQGLHLEPPVVLVCLWDRVMTSRVEAFQGLVFPPRVVAYKSWRCSQGRMEAGPGRSAQVSKASDTKCEVFVKMPALHKGTAAPL